MSHCHWCDYARHYWECTGSAIRLLQAEPSVCMCLQHGIPMEEHDHSACPIELLSCREHRAEHMLAMRYDPNQLMEQPCEQRRPTFRDAMGNPSVGFCLWCGCDFYSVEEHEAHGADHMAACADFQRLKDERIMPPVLEAIFEDAGLINFDREDDE